jgi:hypothetical protein
LDSFTGVAKISPKLTWAKMIDPEDKEEEAAEQQPYTVIIANAEDDELISARVRDRLRLVCERIRNKVAIRNRTDLDPLNRLQVEALFEFRHLRALSKLYNRDIVLKILLLKIEKANLEESITVAELPTSNFETRVTEEMIETLYSRLEDVTEEITKFSPASCIKWHASIEHADLEESFAKYVSSMINDDPETAQLVESLKKRAA